MKFAQLYKENRSAVERALQAMWSGAAANQSQEQYAKKMKEAIKDLFAPADAKPLVQCMNSYEPVHSVPADEATALLGGLWKNDFPPYEHQYQSWKTLLTEKSKDGRPMSICVTTGTGSGKTECFMMPLVRDLIDNRREGFVQALFLYPLNALMEDQKDRLEELLEGSELTYTVYNGDLPEYEPKTDDHSRDAEKLRDRIKAIRGYNEATGEYKYKHLIYTREQARRTPPNILLTNPTMLEYILLRKNDGSLIDATAKSLKWVTIDETHTYTGAGAAELAMLLRRVILAFNVDAHDIRFATSSATFGNGADPAEEERQLKEFISGITGVDTDQVAVIGGKRVGEEHIPDGPDKEKWNLLFRKEYVRLDEMFPEPPSIHGKLEKLDELCERVPWIGKLPAAKAKVHYFYRVPNNGLYIRLTEQQDGAFKLYTQNDVNDTNPAPLLELCKCKHCGGYVAVANFVTAGPDYGKYSPLELDDSNMFDLPEADEDECETKVAVIGLTNTPITRGDNNLAMKVEGEKLVSVQPDEGDWHLAVNTQRHCPYCNSNLTRHKQDEEEVSDVQQDMEHSYLQKFRVAPDFISIQMAPPILGQLEKTGGPESLHDGQSYLSFADSRQMAAKGTMKQNVENERLWVYSTILHELSRRAAEADKAGAKIAELSALLPSLAGNLDEMMRVAEEIKKLKEQSGSVMTWKEIADMLLKDRYCPVYAVQFAKRSSDSEELDDNGHIRRNVMEQYVNSIMVMHLAPRPASAAAPETMGLFHTAYPQIAKIELHAAIEEFNNLLRDDSNKISKQDWQNLLQVFMDYTVRSNQSTYLKLAEDNPIDIRACVRFATEKPRRRPVIKPKMEHNKPSQSRIVRYLLELLHRENPNMLPNDIYRRYFTELSSAVDAMWADLTNPDNKLLGQAEHWDEEQRCFVRDRRDSTRFNLANLCFTLYKDASLVDVNTDNSRNHTECLRPIEVNFKGFSPYLIGNTPVKIKTELQEVWSPYPYYKGSGINPDTNMVREWACENRKLLWNHRLWGEDGIFENRLTDIYKFPNLFVQAEHTAQVDKAVSRTLQKEFKEHRINILACSTTMEMGVDLGNLEVVMLTSVPPRPANYKQRAGRSGRNNKIASACITLCGSDAIGLRTLYNPLENIINRPVKVPTVDLESPQVVQRHVDSYLIRAFGVFAGGENGGKISQRVIDYYTPFTLRKEGQHRHVVDPKDNSTQDPPAMLGNPEGTMYEKFRKMCEAPLSAEVREDLDSLLDGTIYEGNTEYVVRKAKENNDRCYEELAEKLLDYKCAFTTATKERFINLLRMKYMEVLDERLLNFWATHRFTPNANMPVNILPLDLTPSATKHMSTFSANPTYSLREALSQYAPGNSIAVDGVAYIVRGVQYPRMYEGIRSFKTLYHNAEKCVIDDQELPDQMRWPVNDRLGVELVQPIGFIPDVNDDKSRIIDQSQYTRVSAQLIGADKWNDLVTEPHLFSIRSNRESGNAKILYYNEGIGYGYCLCAACGRAVIETEVANPDDTLDKLPPEFNPVVSQRADGRRYHFDLKSNTHSSCSCSNISEKVRRNVIIGDLIQTDYAEIRIRHRGKKSWMNSLSSDNENLLFTLAIVFSQALTDILGKEQESVAFTLMPNGHICIFDVNPGGAGYSNQLANISLMKDVIERSKQILQNAKNRKSKDLLLNKYTLRFINKVDIDSALTWIREEEDSRAVLPDEVMAVSHSSTEVSIDVLKRALLSTSKKSYIFADDDYKHWLYDDAERGWMGRFLNIIQESNGLVSFCLVKRTSRAQPKKAKDALKAIAEDWAVEMLEIASPFADKSIYPVAYINDTLYFTNNPENGTLNDEWANKTLFCARIDNIVK